MPACRVGPLDLSRERGRVVSRYSDVSPTTTTSPWLAGWLAGWLLPPSCIGSPQIGIGFQAQPMLLHACMWHSRPYPRDVVSL